MIKQFIKEAVRLVPESLLRLYLDILPTPAFSADRVQKILVFAYHGLGNFIMFTPALQALRERYPKARIDLQVGTNTGNEEVLAGSSLFDNIYNLPYSAGWRAWLDRFRASRKIGYDVMINEFHSHSWPLAIVVALGGATYRIGHVTSPGWPRRLSRYSFVFNLPVVMREDEHEVERYMDLTAAAGARPTQLAQARPFIHLSDDDRRFASEMIARQMPMGGPIGAGRVIGVQVGTSPSMRWKQWPVERYRELIQRLVAETPGLQVMLFGTASETEISSELTKGLEANVTLAAGKTTVKQVAALIEQCDALLCNDSGLMHVAVAVGTPVVAIYGPTDIRRTAPLGVQHTVIRHELPCSPCFRLEGEHQVETCPHHDCLMTITPDEVFLAVEKVRRPTTARA